MSEPTTWTASMLLDAMQPYYVELDTGERVFNTEAAPQWLIDALKILTDMEPPSAGTVA